MLVHEVMKHLRFPRLRHIGVRKLKNSAEVPYYVLDWSVFYSELPLPSLPSFQEEFKFCQYLLDYNDKRELEQELAEMVVRAVKKKACLNQDFEENLPIAFLDIVKKLCDCAYDLSVNFYYRDKKYRNLLGFLLSWWILQENFRADVVIKYVSAYHMSLKDDIKAVKYIISQLPANSPELQIHEDLLDTLQEAVNAFDEYCEKFTEEEPEDVEITD